MSDSLKAEQKRIRKQMQNLRKAAASPDGWMGLPQVEAKEKLAEVDAILRAGARRVVRG